MKKLILIVVAIVTLTGCEENKPIQKEKMVERQRCVAIIYLNDVQQVPIYNYVIDSCEYIGWITNFHNQFLTHKGNCKNPIHK